MTKKQSTIDSLSELPDWLNSRTWSAFCEMRRKIKKPMTDYAEELVLAKLARFKAEGHDPNSLLDDAIEHDWLTVNPEWSARLVAGRQQGWQGRDQPQQPARRFMTSVEPPLTDEERKTSTEARERVMSVLRPNFRKVKG